MLPTAFLRYQFRRQPQHLILHVTNRCDLRCRHCFVDSSHPQDLPLSLCRELGRAVGRLFWLDIGGGEPFLREDLPEVVAAFDAEVVMIPSNGTQTDRIVEQLREIRRHTRAAVGLALSLDGRQETHDRMRRAGSYEAVWQTFERVRAIAGVSVKINTVLTQENSHEIIEFMQDTRKRHPDFHSVILLRGDPRDPAVGLPPREELRALVPRILAIQDTYDYGRNRLVAGILRNYHRALWEVSGRIVDRKTQAIPCLAGRAHAVVWADASVSPCEMLPPVGNLQQESWEAIRQGVALRRQVASIRRKACYCTHNCALIDSILFNPRCWPRLLDPTGWRAERHAG